MTSTLTTVIPVYNGEGHLRHALESVAEQTRRPDRLIVLDDQSTDGTRDLARQFAPVQCEVVVNPKNLGLFRNHNRALEFAVETDYLHLLHADDVISPEFYARLLPLAEAINGPALVYSGWEFVDEEGRSMSPRRPHPGPPRKLDRNAFLISQTELKAIGIDSAVLKTNRRPPVCLFRTDMPHLGDCVFHGEWAARCAGIIYVPDVLCHIRNRSNNATRKNMKSVQAWCVDEWRAMELIAGLIEESGLNRWLRRQKLLCLFAARTHVKIDLTRPLDAAYASEFAAAGLQIVPRPHWWLGRGAVTIRDLIFGPKTL